MRLVGAVLAEQRGEWQVTHRYMSLGYLAKGTTEVETETIMPLAIAG